MQDKQTKSDDTAKTSNRPEALAAPSPDGLNTTDSGEKSGRKRSRVGATAEAAGSMASRAMDGAQELAHQAGEKAAESWAQLEEKAGVLEERASEALHCAAAETKRVGFSLGRFASTHALPLLAIGAGLGWLRMSMRNERARRVVVRPRSAAPTPSTLTNRRPSYYDAEDTPLSGATTTGQKLMGVRVHDTGYLER